MKISKPAAGIKVQRMNYEYGSNYGSNYQNNLEEKKKRESKTGERVFVVYKHRKGEEIVEVNEDTAHVGTAGGLKGFLEKSDHELKAGKYEYTPDYQGPIRDKHDKNWIELGQFKEIYYFQVDGKTPSNTFMTTLKNKRLNHLLRRRIAAPSSE